MRRETRGGSFIFPAAALAVLALALPAYGQDTPRLMVGVTGSATAEGPANPFNLLNDPSIAELALEAANGPVDKKRVQDALRESRSGATIQNLLDVGVLRAEDNRYVVAFNLFTVADQRRLDAIADRFGDSLAQAVLQRRNEIEASLAAYDLAGVDRRALAFILVGCFALDWDGLEISAQRGMRRVGAVRPNGDAFTPWARERDSSISLKGYYWGSHNRAYADMVVTTFGDHDATRFGLPDLSNRINAGLNSMEGDPELQAAVRRALSDRIGELTYDAGHIMLALRDGALSSEDLGRASAIGDRTDAILPLLLELGYVTRLADNRWSARAVVLTDRDKPMVDAVRAILADVMEKWLTENYEGVRNASQDTTPVRWGVPYDVVFNQLWHYVFGAANRRLVETGMFADPYAPGAPLQGSIPVVWRPQLSEALRR